MSGRNSLHDAVAIAEDTFVMPATLPAPGRGVQYVNPLLVRGSEPMLVDTGAAVLSQEYFAGVRRLIDPEEVRWIFVSHDDRDHTGGLLRLLDMCPAAQVLTSFQAVNRITKETPLPLDRVVFAEIGDTVQVGDHTLELLRPPLFDSPSTRGFFDRRTGLYYAADAYGAVTPAYAQRVEDVSPEDYRDGFYWLNRANTPWLELADPKKLAAVVAGIRARQPSVLVSYHGPVAVGAKVDWVCDLGLTIPVEPVDFPNLELVAAELVQ